MMSELSVRTTSGKEYRLRGRECKPIHMRIRISSDHGVHSRSVQGEYVVFALSPAFLYHLLLFVRKRNFTTKKCTNLFLLIESTHTHTLPIGGSLVIRLTRHEH